MTALSQERSFRMKRILLFILLPCCSFLVGCDQMTAVNAQPKKRATVKRAVPVHRFVQSTFNADIAFDTQTGQMCRTWAWEPISASAKPDPVTGRVPQQSAGQFTPTCASVYLSIPSQLAEFDEDDK
jgi:hypothetical protein